ncbi:opioid growth factor receptor-like protein 1 [Asterias rubens]|uniref:opioid growth factor receptor-like protein 1 n=1 Tax=Asterias rubens TaxID=7604 RepID=UPI001455413C|nr:opioid growth factor receptor-like protein 1 [Asterias rubens]
MSSFFVPPIMKVYGCLKTPILTIYENLLSGDRNEADGRSHYNEEQQGAFNLVQPDRAKQDTLTYCRGYPGKKDNSKLCDNWLFYSNKENGRNGMFIDEVQDWFGNYWFLESRHDYIQRVFPIREKSIFNHRAQELQLHEAKKIREDPAARQRVLMSYRMMLDFWGMHLEDESTGVIVRGENWQERFEHLNRSSHNYQRITRMLKSLGELGFEHLKSPFLTFILYEVFLSKTLINASGSCLDYWIHLLRDETENRNIRKTALEYSGESGGTEMCKNVCP